MLARLNDDEAIAASYLSEDGLQLMVQGAPGVGAERVEERCAEILFAAERLLERRGAPEAAKAWAERQSWVSHASLWRLSWKEAETFAERILKVLVQRYGEGARTLRPALVDHCFEGVRPEDGSGPAPTRWARGASIEARRAAIAKEARAHLSAEQVTDLSELLADRAALAEIVRSE